MTTHSVHLALKMPVWDRHVVYISLSLLWPNRFFVKEMCLTFIFIEFEFWTLTHTHAHTISHRNRIHTVCTLRIKQLAYTRTETHTLRTHTIISNMRTIGWSSCLLCHHPLFCTSCPYLFKISLFIVFIFCIMNELWPGLLLISSFMISWSTK